jgi:SagB-type dehydrogenase family enzyme
MLMAEIDSFLHRTELDRSTFPDLRERIVRAEDLARSEGTSPEARSYPGYPRWPLERVRSRRWGPRLEVALATRRCGPALGSATPGRRTLSRLLQAAHGITAAHDRGPTPSAGGLQALELYLVHWAAAWLPPGLYHYDRRGHHLAQIADRAERASWEQQVPSLRALDGGAMLWVLVGDVARVAAKYGHRAGRFLLLEAGHLMQSLCLLSAGFGLCTVPLGGSFERAIARAFALPPTDAVLYIGACGAPRRRSRSILRGIFQTRHK